MLFQFHENFLSLFLNAVQQNREKGQDIFSEMDYDAMMQAMPPFHRCCSLWTSPQNMWKTAPARENARGALKLNGCSPTFKKT